MAVDRRGAQPFLEHGQVGVGPQGGGSRQEVGLVDVHDEAGDGHARGLRPRVPVEAWSQGGNLLPGGRVVGEQRVAVAHGIAVVGGDRGFQFHDARGRTLRVCHTGEAQEAGGVRDVGLADRRVVVLAVVGLVGQADAGLDEGDHVARRVVRVSAHVCAEEASDALAHEAAHLAGELLVGGAGVDCVEVGAQGSGTGFFDGVLVEELSPQCGDAVRIRIVQCAIGCVLGDCARVLLGCVAQRVERPVHGAVRGDRVGRQPRAVDVAIEIVLRAHRRIDVRGVEDSGEQCLRHALTLGGEVGVAWDERPWDRHRPYLRDEHGT